MNSKIIFLTIFLIFLSLGTVSAGDNSTHDYIPQPVDFNGQVVQATEDGHFNITFSNDYNGYCLEYGEEEAYKGDNFIVANSTAYDINESTANYLKTYFVNFYDEAMKDKVVTQHTIWHFTDGFDGWRVNKTLVQSIKDIGALKTVPDNGIIRYNDTAEMVYSFQTLVSPYEHHQNFFAYKIYFRPITEPCYNITNIYQNITNNYYNITNIYYNIINNTYINNITNTNIYINNTTNIINNTTNICINNITNITYLLYRNINNDTDINNNSTTNQLINKEIKYQVTGTAMNILFAIILLLAVVLITKRVI